MWLLYEFLLCVGLLCYVPKALWRKRLPHPGWSMRLGRYPARVRRLMGARRAVWIHAVSVGEVMAMTPLIDRLAAGGASRPLVVSTVTHTGFGVATRLVGDRGAVIYGPLDLRVVVRRALQSIRPAMLILAESEFWPLLIRGCRRQGIPVVVVNGRVSARAFPRYLLIKAVLRPTLHRIDRFLMQSDVDAQRVIAMGAPPERVTVVGSLKWDAGVMARPDPAQVQETARRLGLGPDDTVFVAGSTHRGEEEQVLAACSAVRVAHGRVRLILAPRHLERLEEVESLARRQGAVVMRASAPSLTSWDVLLVDAMGQLASYYALASVVFVGGSLIPHGGQNPIEPAVLGTPTVFGPFMHNFAEIAQQLVTHQAAVQLTDGATLASTLQQLLVDRAGAQAMGARARALAERLAGATQRTLEALQPLLGHGGEGSREMGEGKRVYF